MEPTTLILRRVIVGGVQYERVTKLLQEKKKALNFFGEVKVV